ncbi:hypothetical protein PENSPDRAFT_654708 [Peniophora sp. CONT]|nr:hypothetical protein PENSPDRAFT_654708 [Peniophora sp. CONT]
MAPPNLQGLNVVQPAPQGFEGANGLQLPASYPDLAQLELWSQLSFSSDEPFAPLSRPSPKENKDLSSDDGAAIEEPAGPARLESHENATQGRDFDLQTLLASFSSEPYAHSQSPAQNLASAQQSLAQILALGVPPNAPAPPATQAPPSKKARTRKASVSVSVADEDLDDDEPRDKNLSPAEDKRRRNTAASARFRAKKKEREAALERRAAELESRVGELERECEGLRRENGWLKGLVVGVTGVGVGGLQPPQVGQKRTREETA